MKNRFWIFALIGFVGLTSVNWTPDDVGIHLGGSAVPNGQGTLISPLPDGKIPPGKNVLYCGTFQMAWDAACKKFGRPIRLLPGSKLANSLNGNRFDRRWVDEGSVFTTEGSVADGVLADIESGVRKKSGHASKLLKPLKKSSQNEDLVFFASLHKHLEFAQPFGRLGNWKVCGHKAPWFGFTPDQKDTAAMRKQVGIHHYSAKDDFVIELLTQQDGDQLLLAKFPAAPATIETVSRGLIKHLKKQPANPEPEDLLAVPNIVAEESARFTKLEGQKVAKSQWILRHALQTIDFRLDEKGVKLDSEAAVSFGCAAKVPMNPRLIILDPPFALMMKRKNAPQAYFVAWIGNADLLKSK